MSEIDAVLDWVKRELPALLASDRNWQLTLHGSRGGDIQSEIKTTGSLLAGRKQRLEERHGSSASHVRPVR